MKYLCLILISTALSACAVFLPKTDNQPVPQLKGIKCDPIKARIGFTIWPFEMRDLDRYSLGDKHHEFDSEKDLLALIKNNIEIKILSKTSEKESITIGFSTEMNTHNYGYLWISTLTLGIVPVILDGEHYLVMRVFDKDGQFLKEYHSEKTFYDVYGGFWFWPMAVFSDRTTQAKEMALPRAEYQMRTLIEQAARDKVFSCQ